LEIFTHFKESASKKSTFFLLWNTFQSSLSICFVSLEFYFCVDSDFKTVMDYWFSACHILLEFPERRKFAVVPENGVQRYHSELLATVLLAIILIYSFQRSFQLKVIPRHFAFLDQGKEWLSNFNSCRHLCAGWVMNTAVTLKISVISLKRINWTGGRSISEGCARFMHSGCEFWR
jgi:hypothetical protein